MSPVTKQDAIAGAVGFFVGVVVVIAYVRFHLSRMFTDNVSEGILSRTLGVTARKVRISETKQVQIISCVDPIPFTRSFRPELLFLLSAGAGTSRSNFSLKKGPVYTGN